MVHVNTFEWLNENKRFQTGQPKIFRQKTDYVVW